MSNQKEVFLKSLPASRDFMVKEFKRKGWSESSVSAVAWQLKKARKIHVNKTGVWVKKRSVK